MPTPASTVAARAPLLSSLIVLTLAAVALALWYLTSYSLRGGGEVRWHAAAPACELGVMPCEAPLGEGRLTFAIEAGDEIRALEPLPMRVTLEGVEAERVRVDLVGRDMEMGLHRFPLEREADDVFRGMGQVPICTRAIMAWRAEVVVATPSGPQGSRFEFDVESSRP